MATKKILVLGGTGFVGREICRRAAMVGFKVTSLSRRGRIPYTYLTAEDVRDWEKRIDWKNGDATQKDVLQTLIPQHDAIIHSIGIMFENAFNTLVSGSKSDATGISYETANMETALVPLSILEAQATQGTPTPFIFISACSHPPFLKRYLTTKQIVEKRMMDDDRKGLIRAVIFRPGMVYHHSKWTSLPIAKMATLASFVDRTTTAKFGLSFGLPEPTPLDLLATCAVRAAARPVQGIFTNKEMWTLAESPEI